MIANKLHGGLSETHELWFDRRFRFLAGKYWIQDVFSFRQLVKILTEKYANFFMNFEERFL